jgi:hypothetical protein
MKKCFHLLRACIARCLCNIQTRIMSVVVDSSSTITQKYCAGLSLLILDTNQYCALSTHERSPPVRLSFYNAMMSGDFDHMCSVVKEEENLAYKVKCY